MIREIETYFLIFAIAAILGWGMESFTSLFYPETKKLVNRGFLIGPYLPVYGFGVAGISFALNRFSDNIPFVFILSLVLCTFIEYFTSYVLEKVFHARWWDYSNKKWNINGRVYVVNMFLFGFAGVIIVKIADPILFYLLDKIPDLYMHIASGVFLGIISIDTIISCIIAFGLKKASTEVTDEIKDSTLEVNEERKEITAKVADKTKKKIEGAAAKTKSTIVDTTVKTKKTIEGAAAKTKSTIVDTTVKTKKTIEGAAAKTKKTIVDTTTKTKGKIAETTSKTKQTIANTATKIKSFKPIPFEEMQSKIKERFASQNKWSHRLTQAFPNMKISLPIKKDDKEIIEEKSEKENTDNNKNKTKKEK